MSQTQFTSESPSDFHLQNILTISRQANELIDSVDDKLSELENISRILTTKPNENAYSKLDKLKGAINAKLLKLKDLLEDIQKFARKGEISNFNPQLYHIQVVKFQYKNLSTCIKMRVNRFSSIQFNLTTGMKSNLAHLLKSANKEVSPDELDEMIQKGNVGNALISDVAKNQILALTERTDKLKSILTDIKEIQEMQNALCLLIDDAGDVLDEIEATFANVNADVNEGVKNVKTARMYQVARYKWYIIIAIPILIGIGVGIFYIYKAVKKKDA